MRVPAKAEGLSAHVGEDARGDALGGTTPFILVDLISDQQVKEALHPVLDVVRKGIPAQAAEPSACQRGEPQWGQVRFLRFSWV